MIGGTVLYAQNSSETSSPLYTLYATQHYKAHNQNWSITQDSTQRIYVANNYGLLRFDGTYWELSPSLNGGLFRSLTKDSAGTVYWGGQNDFGYLTSDSSGFMVLHSLAHLLPDTIKNYHNVWRILSTNDGVYFRTNDYLFRYHKEKLHVLEYGANFRHMSLIDGRIVLYKYRRGLFFVDENNFSFIPGSELFLTDLIGGIEQLENGNWLILTFFKGMYIYDGHDFKLLKSPINETLKTALGYKSLTLSNGNIAIATIHSGLFIIDQRGNLVTQLHIEELSTTGLFQDAQKGLWVALDGGIARIEVESPLSVFSKKAGFPGTSNTITRYRGNIYAGGNTDLFKLQTFPDRMSKFVSVEGYKHQTWSLLSTPYGMLIASQNGLFVLKDDVISTIKSNNTYRKIIASSILKDTYFVGGLGELRMLPFSNGEWNLGPPIAGIETNVHYITEASDSTLWIGSHYQGVTRIRNLYSEKKLVIDRFTEEDGFPERNDKYTGTYWVDDHLTIGTSSGLYKVDEQHNKVIPDSSFGPLFAGPGKDVFRAEMAADGNWYIRSSDSGILKMTSGAGPKWDSLSLRRLPIGAIFDFHIDAEGPVWLAGNRGIARFNSQSSYSYSFVPVINFQSVSLINNDSLVFGGVENDQLVPFVFNSDQNGIRFQFSLSSYDHPTPSMYAFRLKGLEEEWSRWTSETQKDYTNLPNGNFSFEVKGKDLYENESELASFAFSISPAWYLTKWAKFVYVFLGIGFIALLIQITSKIRTRRLKEHNQRLEQEVKNRTAVIEQSLAEKEILLKEIHHRVKNNLQIIYSLLNLQKSSITDQKVLEAISVGQDRIKSMSLVHEILYKNENVKQIELARYIQNLVNHIESTYQKREKEVQTGFNLEPCEVDLTMAIPLGLIINEVVSNAFKHAFKGSKKGLLKIMTTRKEGFLKLIITDNGPGYNPERFTEGETLGLMLINDMIRQLKGEKKLYTASGTRYILKIPLSYE